VEGHWSLQGHAIALTPHQAASGQLQFTTLALHQHNYNQYELVPRALKNQNKHALPPLAGQSLICYTELLIFK